MKVRFDRRARMFLVFAFASFVLIELAPVDFRWVGELLTFVYLFLAFISWLDNQNWRSSSKSK